MLLVFEMWSYGKGVWSFTFGTRAQLSGFAIFMYVLGESCIPSEVLGVLVTSGRVR